MTLKHPDRLWLASLFVAWCFDQLFWGKTPGISFFLFILLAVTAGLLLADGEGAFPARRSYWLLLPLTFFAGMTAIRQEPFTNFVNVMLVLLVLMLAALTLRSGLWPLYSLSDYVAGYLRLMVSSLAKPVNFLIDRLRKASTPVENGAAAPARRSALWGILRGVLLALPVVLVMAALLASADAIFSKQLAGLLDWFKIDKLVELVYRAIYISFLAFILLGVYLHSLTESQDEKLLGQDKPWMPAFLDWTEAAIVLGSVVLLFAFFVGIQFQYFFGGQANIKLEGFTYADYARRGFGELVFVAVLSLLLFLGLSTVTRRQNSAQKRSFSGLGIALVALVAVMLVSAYQRLVLYEQAYGFSRLRTYTHVFMVWLGILLLATILLEIMGRMRSFALVFALVAVCVGLTTNLINVDGFIVRQNVARAVQGFELDSAYLASLSDDAVPPLVSSFNQAGLPAKVKDEIGASLACRAAIQADRTGSSTSTAWQSYHYSTYRAVDLMSQVSPALKAYPVNFNSEGVLTVTVNGQAKPCLSFTSMD
jgi:hypothetical protein